jgi:hypothetical protein
MSQPGEGRGLPLLELLVSHLGIGGTGRIREPGIELIGSRTKLGAESAQVVIAHAASPDQHSQLPQWLKRAANFNVSLRIKSSLQ